MRSHSSVILPRIIRAGLRVTQCRYRVVAVGLDRHHNMIRLCTNSPRLPLRGYHAEERVMHSTPRLLSCILIARVGADGRLLPIDPCPNCQRMADRRGVKIIPLRLDT